jgi:hypothetical protein
VTFAPRSVNPSLSGTITVASNASNSPSVQLSGAGTDALAVSPASLDFGNQAVGLPSAPRQITIANVGSVAAGIASIDFKDRPIPDYSVTTTCPLLPMTLASNTSCTAAVTFTPSAPTSGIVGQLTIRDNTPGGPHSVSLTGSGIQPHASVAPSASTFATLQPLGTTSAPQTVTLTNDGNGPLTVTAIASLGDFSQTTTCPMAPATLAAGANCTVAVAFQPTAGGTRTGSLQFSDDATNSPQTVSLTGTGLAASLSVSTTHLDFFDVVVGTTSAQQSVTLNNNGTVDITFSGVATHGDFAIVTSTSTCGASLSAGSSCVVALTFGPTATGTRSGDLTISSNAAGSPQVVTLTGNGVANGSIVPQSSSFPPESVGSSGAARTFAVRNTTDDALTVVSVQASNDFSVQSETCTSASLAPQQACSVVVQFAPAALGTRTGTLSVEYADGSIHEVLLSGYGSDAPIVSTAPSEVRFLSRTDPLVQHIAVTNLTPSQMAFGKAALGGLDPEQFSVVDDTCDSSLLQSQGSCSVTVMFTPSASGLQSAVLVIPYDGPDGQLVIPLVGMVTGK